ncbi:MAG TPA: YbhB/YbcL family Raf kinase inhibitor-like protein [Deltaproteobacteria bacterium]|nr:YbhB/YbcL family Raf kinase inhibitor-like protein [Deltaproteobacteria bacterium]HQJ08410.1 YbhB/YbcL family Raf kinase inhibitor-like protein [Deltaproteobacteria bacterium]
MEVESSAFGQGGMIPSRYTCEGNNVSPPLAWKGAPQGTKSIALVADDPDSPKGSWVHWVYYDIPMQVSHLPENISKRSKPDTGGAQGVNDFRNVGYDGPCPPSGTHRYYFKVYALDTVLGLKPGASKKELLKAMEGHVLSEGTLMGRFAR